MMDYISVKEAALIWGMDPSNIGKLLRKGKINGAKIVARNWLIPKDAPKPIDGRTKKAKSEGKMPFFRFPLLVNSDEDSFAPPLSDEEKMLRRAELDYYACDFDKAKSVFDKFLKDTRNIYIKITVLFYLCSASVEVYGGKDFANYYAQLQAALASDFPYKKEMNTVIPWLNAVLAQYSSVSESLNFNLEYEYSPTVIHLISHLSLYHIADDLQMLTNPTYLDSYELLCQQMEQSGAYYEACESHLSLFSAHYLALNEDATTYHLRKGMDIAREHNFPLIPSCYYSYYQDAFEKIADEYPKDFIDKIKHTSKGISKSFSEFTEKYDITKIYSRLSSKDYRYLLFALNGCTNREIAAIMNISERTVTYRYTEIFNKLGVNSKKELLELTDYRFKE